MQPNDARTGFLNNIGRVGWLPVANSWTGAGKRFCYPVLQVEHRQFLLRQSVSVSARSSLREHPTFFFRLLLHPVFKKLCRDNCQIHNKQNQVRNYFFIWKVTVIRIAGHLEVQLTVRYSLSLWTWRVIACSIQLTVPKSLCSIAV